MYLFCSSRVALGTIIGGPVGDKIGRKQVIWISILGMAPFALLMPFANLFWTAVLSVVIGFIMASAFPAILVYATDAPGKVGTIAGLSSCRVRSGRHRLCGARLNSRTHQHPVCDEKLFHSCR